MLATALVSLVLSMLQLGMREDTLLVRIVEGVDLLVALGFLVPTLGMGARRLHDAGRSGWWQLLLVPLLLFVPWSMVGPGVAVVWGPWWFASGVLGWAGLLMLLMVDSLPGVNRWGESKRNGDGDRERLKRTTPGHGRVSAWIMMT
ncbi:hypothetical protein GCM10008955_33820 [Deinococcus malanensis]|uniref:DUF805 domain-containing protein n=3 Tax=Deinococcus malanensis TaxID=1706855 RepID=A0ABQ2F100_9DEIO|nr:hypothetical protein GCM10008955_33820 [Deinococcus malanensis]